MTQFLAIAATIFAASALAFAFNNLNRIKRVRLRLENKIESLLASIEAVTASLDQVQRSVAERQAEFATRRNLDLYREKIDGLEEGGNFRQRAIDHLRGEHQNLAMLATWHPKRVTLSDELRPRLDPVTRLLTPVLFPNQIAFDELDWMYRLPDRKFPYSMTFEEGMLIHHLIAESGLKSGYEIATAFGLSSFFIATAMEKTGGHLISVDAYIEEAVEDFLYDHQAVVAHVDEVKKLYELGKTDQLPRGLQFATKGADVLGVSGLVEYRVACSPEGIPDLLDERLLDFAFVDGGHFGDQPILDVKSVLPFLNRDRYLLIFHDTQCEAVAKAVHVAAEELDTEPFPIHTRNRLIAISRGINKGLLDECRKMTVRQFI